MNGPGRLTGDCHRATGSDRRLAEHDLTVIGSRSSVEQLLQRWNCDSAGPYPRSTPAPCAKCWPAHNPRQPEQTG